jgi:hypothetical protein
LPPLPGDEPRVLECLVRDRDGVAGGDRGLGGAEVVEVVRRVVIS